MAIWLLVFGVAAVLVRVGMTLLVGGSVRPAHVGETLLRSFAETAAAGLAFWAVGAPLLLGRGPFLAFDLGLVMTQSADQPGLAFFHTLLATFGGAVIAGAIAERSRFHVSVVACAVWGGIVFPMVGHLVWFGWLRQLNVIDFGGASAIHLTAALFAAIGVAAVGSRPGRYAGGVAVVPRPIEGLSMVTAGVALVVVGWTPYLLASLLVHPTDFNPLSTAALAVPALAVTAMNALVAALAGGVGGMVYGRLRYGRADLVSAYTGMLGALVAISAACVAVGSLGAVMIGGVAGWLVPAAAGFMDRRARLDDPAGLVAVHGFGGAWGMLAAAMFAAGQSPIDHLRLLAVQALAVVIAMTAAAVAAGVTFGLLRLVRPLRQADV